MAWSESRIFDAFLDDLLTVTAAFDVESDTLKAALYDNDITPDSTAASASTAYNAGQWTASGNEVADGTNWDAGGEPLTNVAVGNTASVISIDADDTPQGGASTTLTNAFGCLIHDDTLTTPVADQGICYLYFGGGQSVTASTFTIVYPSGGFVQYDQS